MFRYHFILLYTLMINLWFCVTNFFGLYTWWWQIKNDAETCSVIETREIYTTSIYFVCETVFTLNIEQQGTRKVGSRRLRWLQGAGNDIQGLKVKWPGQKAGYSAAHEVKPYGCPCSQWVSKHVCCACVFAMWVVLDRVSSCMLGSVRSWARSNAFAAGGINIVLVLLVCCVFWPQRSWFRA
jgi:hypothetical protein